MSDGISAAKTYSKRKDAVLRDPTLKEFAGECNIRLQNTESCRGSCQYVDTALHDIPLAKGEDCLASKHHESCSHGRSPERRPQSGVLHASQQSRIGQIV